MPLLPFRRFSVDTSWSPDEIALAVGAHLNPDAAEPRFRGQVDARGFRLELGGPEGRGPLVRGRVVDRPAGSRVEITVSPGPAAWRTLALGLVFVTSLVAVGLGLAGMVRGEVPWVFFVFPLFGLRSRGPKFREAAARVERFFIDLLPAPVSGGGTFRSPAGRRPVGSR
ncbi:MAG TPA: hypothetical protein VFS43_15655 [Polyangiaceae bacterium]|nr:hypothetical protein [Polyangiaceae bacterium]